MLRLLCVTAHPDDEAGGFGGSLLLASERGIETYIICLTPGQAASNRGTSRNDDELAAMRRKEFAAACEHLHATGGYVLDYPDSRLDQQSLYQVVGDLTRRIRQIKPQVVDQLRPRGLADRASGSLDGRGLCDDGFSVGSQVQPLSGAVRRGTEAVAAAEALLPDSDFTIPERQPVALSPVSARIEIGHGAHGAQDRSLQDAQEPSAALPAI